MKAWLFFLLVCAGAKAQEFSVYFDFAKDVPNESSKAAFAGWRAENPEIQILSVSGYCDSVDTDAFNKELAARRIKSVTSLLGLSPEAMRNVVSKAIGEEHPQRANAAESRRVDIRYRVKTDAGSESVEAVSVNPKTAAPTVDSEEALLPDTSIASKFENAKPGDLIRVQNINFYRNSEVVVPESMPRLGELLQVMLDHPGLRIEIHGHICCNPNPNDTKLSYRRAKFIFTYLLKRGIALNRLGYTGFGSSHPIYPIPEKTWQEEAANRRVEILVKSVR
jgi:outer membrane protein OmpA-like peptidoglycan-associated protein